MRLRRPGQVVADVELAADLDVLLVRGEEDAALLADHDQYLRAGKASASRSARRTLSYAP